ncbi:MFS transporter [Lentzea sp. NPDC058450]|uniref:MFS transporter n=1 Tax=Lentzea sp. NPDC058450 TaxID=3346505 RepID=UPI00364A4631
MSSREALSAQASTTTGITRQQWKWAALAGMASYLDAGSIVALGAGLPLFQEMMGLSGLAVGALAAIGPNAIGCAIGAFIGGRLGDKLGRKRIYKWDLLVYAFGILLIAASANPAMLFIGTFIVGVAVGADVPTSLALVGEISPARSRGRLVGFTQVAWSLGPVVVLLMALAVAPLGVLGIRLVFLQLFLVAIVTWALRRGITESTVWQSAASTATTAGTKFAALFRGANLKALLWTGSIYTFWGVAAGTAGIFTPYIVKTLDAGSQAAGVALACAQFSISIVVIIFVVMRYSDSTYRARRLMWGIGSIMSVVAYGLFLVFPFTVPLVLANVILFGIGGTIAGEATYKTFSQELFPTMLRSTAQGFTFGVARVLLGIWSFFVPVLAAAGIGLVGLLLAAFLAIAGFIGYAYMPDTVGKSLEEIEQERAVA